MGLWTRLFRRSPRDDRSDFWKAGTAQSTPAQPQYSTQITSLNTQIIHEDGKPIYVDPTSIDSGFLLFPRQMSKILNEALVHQALLTNKSQLWAAVQRVNPSVPIHLVTTNQNIDPKDAILALRSVGKYDGHNIGLDNMQMSPDGGRTLVKIYVGFTWRSSEQIVYVAAPQMILPTRK